MRTLVLIAAMVYPIVAQEPAKPARVQKIVQLKHADPKRMDVLTLSFPPEVMPAVEEAIKRFDVLPAGPSSIELTAYFLVASNMAYSTDVPVPPELDAVVKQIRSVFAFKNFSLLDTLLLRAADGSVAQVSGQVDDRSSPPRLTRFSVANWSVRTGEKGDVISIGGLRAGLRIPVSNGKDVTYIDTGLDLSRVEAPVGQNVVIGKSSLAGPGKALVIVLRARVP